MAAAVPAQIISTREYTAHFPTKDIAEIADKTGIEERRFTTCIREFGNTSSVSIPLTILSQLQGKLDGSNKFLLSGFGVHMS